MKEEPIELYTDHLDIDLIEALSHKYLVEIEEADNHIIIKLYDL